jgi:hypothetical protein
MDSGARDGRVLATLTERNQAVAQLVAMMRFSGFQKFGGSEPKVKIYPAFWSGFRTSAFWL